MIGAMNTTPPKPFRRLAVIGAGAWGTALAITAGRSAQADAVWLWAHEPEVVASINGQRANALFLPHIQIPALVRATNDLAEAASAAEALLIAVPAQYVRRVTAALSKHLSAGAPLVICAKGIELETGR